MIYPAICQSQGHSISYVVTGEEKEALSALWTGQSTLVLRARHSFGQQQWRAFLGILTEKGISLHGLLR